MKDRPFALAGRRAAPNRLTLRSLKTVVLSDEETAQVMCQAGISSATAGDRAEREDSMLGKNVVTFPETVPFAVTSLSEPSVVALHVVGRPQARLAYKVIVFGVGPIGSGGRQPPRLLHMQ